MIGRAAAPAAAGAGSDIHTPWQGRLEYRIWQRMLYLRGTLSNPFRWVNPIMPLPYGVEFAGTDPMAVAQATNGSRRAPVHVGDDRTGTRPNTLVVSDWNNDIHWTDDDDDDVTATHLCLDGVSFALKPNPPYVP